MVELRSMRVEGEFANHWICVGCVDGSQMFSETEELNRALMSELGYQRDNPAIEPGAPEHDLRCAIEPDVDMCVRRILTGGLKQVVCSRSGGDKGPRRRLGCAAKVEGTPSI